MSLSPLLTFAVAGLVVYDVQGHEHRPSAGADAFRAVERRSSPRRAKLDEVVCAHARARVPEGVQVRRLHPPPAAHLPFRAAHGVFEYPQRRASEVKRQRQLDERPSQRGGVGREPGASHRLDRQPRHHGYVVYQEEFVHVRIEEVARRLDDAGRDEQWREPSFARGFEIRSLDPPRGRSTGGLLLEHEVDEHEVAVQHRELIARLKRVLQSGVEQRGAQTDDAQQEPCHPPPGLVPQVPPSHVEAVEGHACHRHGAHRVPKLGDVRADGVVSLAPVDVRGREGVEPSRPRVGRTHRSRL